ncbi:MAG: primosomal protein [Verrucomicrobia bacterium]|nr:primosomal protein [Verrucomicrobiota bacterium]
MARRQMNRGAVVLCFLCLSCWVGLQADTPRKARQYMERGQYADAMRIYDELAVKHPKDSRYYYNAGVAAYKAMKFAEAQEYFDAASLSEDLDLQQQSFYNRGNALFKAGEEEANFERKTQMWKEAIDQFDHAVNLNETDQMAQDNLQFVKQQLENLQQQQQDQNPDQNSDENKDEESEQDNEQQNDQNQSEQDQQDQDQQNQDQQQQDQNDQDQQQNSSQDQQNEQQDEQNSPSEGESSEEEQQNPSQPQDGEQEEQEQNAQPQEGEPSDDMPQTTMSPQQAMQLLDSERGEAKSLIFRPPDKRRPKQFKDW